ncbi:hypothetical protein CYMTET_40763 [Cymbomonas tetramitiformis]|uniref:Uncharacterized protein n=1 Tax=Cymbomonas tetramitiformis TaxID=36881 RepID=A0AAE0C8H8_9CHLO|nr:hypothetical protein CYMTET_40763 [Cymbomonas tetramitiformis]
MRALSISRFMRCLPKPRAVHNAPFGSIALEDPRHEESLSASHDATATVEAVMNRVHMGLALFHSFLLGLLAGSDVRDDKSGVDYSEVAKRRHLVTKHQSNGAFTSFVPASENNKSPFKHILDVLRSLLSLKSLNRTGTVVAMALACLLAAPTAAEAAKSSGRMGGSARSSVPGGTA